LQKGESGDFMNIVNLIHIGDEVKNLDHMSETEKQDVACRLNAQALRHVGYRPKEKTA